MIYDSNILLVAEHVPEMHNLMLVVMWLIYFKFATLTNMHWMRLENKFHYSSQVHLFFVPPTYLMKILRKVQISESMVKFYAFKLAIQEIYMARTINHVGAKICTLVRQMVYKILNKYLQNFLYIYRWSISSALKSNWSL